MKRYRKKRQYEWSAAIAYSVGLMASDGCLSLDGRHLDLTSVDIEQLENFSAAIDKSLVPSLKSTGSRATRNHAYRVQFSDVAYYDFLVNAGLSPRKSRVISEVKIPPCYFTHFLRGIFDGDGTVYAYFDKRWRSSYMFYVQFASASRPFLEYLLVTARTLIGVTGGSIHGTATKGAYTLSFAKADSALLYAAMYSGAGNLFLARKRIKLAGYLFYEKSGTIIFNARVLKLVDRHA